MRRVFSMSGWIRRRHLISQRTAGFMHAPWAGGVVLLACVVVAMTLANLPHTSIYYRNLLHTDLAVKISAPTGVIDWTFPRDMTVEKFINDGLMVIFFFVVGLEIKREIVCGQLSRLKQAILPILAAVGGMVVPAIIYMSVNGGTAAAHGWGIPMATDIAFAIGILSLMGDRVPVSLKIFLTALAIADDLGAIIVIAVFYGAPVQWGCLAIALMVMLGVYVMKRLGETRMIYYLVPAVIVWSLFYYSGVHSTVSGVAMAMLIPMRPRYSKEYFYHKGTMLAAQLIKADNVTAGDFPNEEHQYFLRRLHRMSVDAVGLSDRLIHNLAPYVTFVIMPIFALANAGVKIDSIEYFNIFHYSDALGSIGLGVFFGLLLGKPLGIFLASWLAVKTKLAEMPEGSTWRTLFAVACLGGIGFTMSIFVDSLAFTDTDIINRGKIAILIGSAAAAILGIVLILAFSKRAEEKTE